jgi:ABC-type glycerol-3-phosphate transport system permease component
VIGTLLNVAITLMAGYVLSRKQFFFKKFAMIMLVITMFFNGGLIPTFLVIKSLGLFNTRWALILPVLTTTWNIIITRTYVQTNIPDGLIESAKIDGYNDIFIVFKIVLPLSAPIIAVIALFAAVGYWNDYFSALLYLPEITKQPISLFLRRILLQASATEVLEEMEGMEEAIFYANQIKYSVIIITILPILFVYPFLQKYFAKGIMVGSLKG